MQSIFELNPLGDWDHMDELGIFTMTRYPLPVTLYPLPFTLYGAKIQNKIFMVFMKEFLVLFVCMLGLS